MATDATKSNEPLGEAHLPEQFDHQTSYCTDLDTLLNESQTAELLNVSMRTLQAWRARGLGPPVVRLGRAVRFRRRDLLLWIDNNTISQSEHATKK
jgi:predicted DNA-binding transcriptional regulator AlpA